LRRISVKVMMAVLVTLVALFFAAKLRYSGKTTVKLPAESCNAGLWKHVYFPERLHVIEACSAVEGRVASVHRAVDGDLHIGLEPEHASVLNLVNVIHSQRQLVVEIVCEHAPADKGAVATCAGFTTEVSVPKVGDRVRVTGAYVTDSDNGWNELHPVTRIEVLP
jgi:hypothetical protein